MEKTPTADPLERLLGIMARLRDPVTGCEWDCAQSFASIAPYTIEEAYEVADAIGRADMVALRDELGDLLLQVVFHARMAEEAGHFAFGNVAAAIADKMEARHPHIFGGTGADTSWETIKAGERAAKGATSAVDGVALALPGLMRAQKLQARAARVGFDWPDTAGPAEKLAEEIQEFAEASSDEARAEEAGDLLFAAVNLLRAHGIDAEAAARAANAKFERRFRAMEALAVADGVDFAALSLAEQDALWNRVKAGEKAATAG